MTERYDAIVIGAGHNGLVCGAYLAKSGRRVLVLERADQVGGAAVTREFAPEFRVSAGAHIVHLLQPKIIRDLDLKAQGLDLAGPAIDTVTLDRDGGHLVLGRDRIDGPSLSGSDKAAYRDFMGEMRRYARALAPELLKAPPRLADAGPGNALHLAGLGWSLRFGLGKTRLRNFLRIVGMNIHDLVEEEFDTEALKAALAFDAVLGTNREPRMPGTVLSYLYRLAGGLKCDPIVPAGGMGRVGAALGDAARSLGAEIRTGAAVDRVLMQDGRAGGVILADGEKIEAATVISNADPRTTFLTLVGARNLEAQFAHRIGNFRSRGRAAKIHMALDDPPEFAGLDRAALGNRLVVAPSRRYLEKAFNASKYGACPQSPALEITIPTIRDESLAPDGKHVLSAIAQYLPYEPREAPEAQKSALIERVTETISAYAPEFRSLVRHVECLLPQDIEAEFGISGGHWHHGELAIDQMFMMRPTYGAAQYRTPVDGLYLCGAGAHPGGGVMGAAGHNAAKAVLAETK